MILVTVGTNPFSFDRLLKVVDELIEKRKIKEKVIMQIGHSTYIPKNAKWFRLTSYKKMEELNKKARIVITHGGAGSILTALKFKKPVIAVPRLRKFNEHTDDHQLDLVRVMSEEGFIIGLYRTDQLEKAIKMTAKMKRVKTTKNMLIKTIKDYLKSVENE